MEKADIINLFQVREIEDTQKALSTLESEMKRDWIPIRIDFKEMTFENVLKIDKILMRR